MVLIRMIFGSALTSAEIPTYKPSFFEINLKILTILNILKTCKFPTEGNDDITDNSMIKQSIMFHMFLKQLFYPFFMRPQATILRKHSTTKITVVAISISSRVFWNLSLGSFSGLQRASYTHVRMMDASMNLSNQGFMRVRKTQSLNLCFREK